MIGNANDGERLRTANEWIVQALGAARAAGGPPLGFLAGVTAVTGPRHGVRFRNAPAPQQLGILEIALLADLAVGGAIRAQVGVERLLPTLSLSIELTSAPGDAADVIAWTTRPAVHTNAGTAAAVLERAGNPIGSASALFAVRPGPAHRAMPWDQPGPMASDSALTIEDLTPDEQRILHTLAEADNDPNSGSWGDQLIRRSLRVDRRDGGATLELMPTPGVTNRAGAVSGAVLFAFAAIAASEAAGVRDPVRQEGIAGHIRYFTAADAAAPIRADARIESGTGRTIFLHCRLTQGSAMRANAEFVIRRHRP